MKSRIAALVCFLTVLAAGNVLALGSKPKVSPLPSAELSATVAGGGKLDAENGFRGLRFGAPFSAVKSQMQLVTRKGKWQFHSRRKEKLLLGEAELMSVHYGFYRKKFVSVSIYVKGEKNSQAALAWLKSRYGSGTRYEETQYRQIWDGEKVRAVYDYNVVSRSVALSIVSRELLGITDDCEYPEATPVQE